MLLCLMGICHLIEQDLVSVCILFTMFYLFRKVFFSFFLDVDECTWTPCENNATCINNNGSYTCNCSDGWEGNHCDEGMTYYDENLFYFSYVFCGVKLLRKLSNRLSLFYSHYYLEGDIT